MMTGLPPQCSNSCLLLQVLCGDRNGDATCLPGIAYSMFFCFRPEVTIEGWFIFKEVEKLPGSDYCISLMFICILYRYIHLYTRNLLMSFIFGGLNPPKQSYV